MRVFGSPLSKRSRLRLDIETLQAMTDRNAQSDFAWDIVVRNPKLYHFVARRVFFVVDADALSEARIALYRALLYVDLAKGSVITVAYWFCTRARSTQYGVHVSAAIQAKVYPWVGRGKNILDPAFDLGSLTDEERKRVAWLIQPWQRELESHPDPRELEELTVEPNDEGPDLKQLRHALHTMSALSRDALLAGMGDDNTFRAVGKIHKLSRERIRQIHNAKIEHLRGYFCRTPELR